LFSEGFLKESLVMKKELTLKVKEDFVSFLTNRIEEQELFYKKFGFDDIDFSDLKEKIRKNNFFEEDYDRENDFFVVIPKNWNMEKAFKMIKNFFRLKMSSIVDLSKLKNEREESENYLISFPLDGDFSKSGERISLMERFMIEVVYFFENSDKIDNYLEKLILCSGSRHCIKCNSANKSLFPFLGWDKNKRCIIIDYALEPNNFIEVGKINVIN
jgi:hypothetical protein